MLLKFSVENYRSFKDEVTINFIASSISLNTGRTIKNISADSSIEVLPCSLIYGANASGKSNLITAIKSAWLFLIAGGAIPFAPFKLDVSSLTKPSVFNFLFSYSDRIFSYGFSVSHEAVIEETLYEHVNGSYSEIYRRKGNEISFSQSIFTEDEDEVFYKTAAKLVPSTKLFLREAYERRFKAFKLPVEWFITGIRFVNINIYQHETQLIDACRNNPGVYELLKTVINTADTGIENAEIVKHKMTPDELDRFLNSVPNLKTFIEKESHHVGARKPDKVTVSLRSKSVELIDGSDAHQYDLKLLHSGKESAIPFSFDEESDGTRIFLAMMPILWNTKCGEDVTYIIDEIDRSLHTKLLQHFLRMFLDWTSKSQLVATLHDPFPMDMPQMRPDGIVLMTKNKKGISQLNVVAEYENYADFLGKFSSAYMNDRFSGIPYIEPLIDEKDIPWDVDNQEAL